MSNRCALLFLSEESCGGNCRLSSIKKARLTVSNGKPRLIKPYLLILKLAHTRKRLTIGKS